MSASRTAVASTGGGRRVRAATDGFEVSCTDDPDRRARLRFSAYLARLQRLDAARRADVERRRLAFETRWAAAGAKRAS